MNYKKRYDMDMTGDEFIEFCSKLKKTKKFQKSLSMFASPVPELPKGWTWSCLSKISERVSVGHVGPTSEFFTNESDGIPFIRSQDVRPGKLMIHNALNIVPKFHEKLKKSQLKVGDVLIVRVGANRGDVCEVPPNMGQLNCANVVFARPIVANGFVTYFFRSSFGREMLLSITTGSAQGVLNTLTVARLPIPIPPLATQNKISAILSAYDDLIEVNQRRITLLEKISHGIYREWFVRLRFPGHERIKVNKGVPEGWFFDKAGVFIGIVKGKSYAGDELTDDITHMPFINLKSFNRGGGYRANGLKYYSGKFKSEQVAKYKDVVMAVTDMTQDRVIIGQVARMPNVGEKGAVVSLDTVKLVPKNIDKTFLYAYMRHSGFSNYIKEFANGANVLHLKPDLVTKQHVIIPPKELQVSFAKIAEPLYDFLDLLVQQNELLAKTRDSLLPRLISGKLSVEHLDIQFPPSMLDETVPLST